jgi:uncharacterized protein YndB with AHSA1/START domain
MRKLKIGLIALAVIVVGFILVVAMQPAEFRIARTATIDAPADAVFARVNDFRGWKDWSPWAKLDPAMKETYGGASAGVGASYAWEGDDQVGSGRMTIAESRPGELIRINLEFLEPFAAENTAEFAFTPEGSGTAVTWSMTGRNGFIAKAAGLFLDIDGMVGGDFEKGLAQLKAAAEAAPASLSSATAPPAE